MVVQVNVQRVADEAEQLVYEPVVRHGEEQPQGRPGVLAGRGLRPGPALPKAL